MGKADIQEPAAASTEQSQEPATASSEVSGKWLGLCEKDIIHTVEDFRRTVQKDPVLSEHFSSFNWDTAKFGKQEKEVSVFVSYRRDNVIKRTSKPIRLPKGDGYISDGRHIARTFCCNDYVIDPAGTPAAGGTSPAVGGAAPEDPVEPARIASAAAPARDEVEPVVEEPYSVPPPPIHPPSYYPPPPRRVTPPEPPPHPTPEPATILLFGTGLAGLIAASRRKKA